MGAGLEQGDREPVEIEVDDSGLGFVEDDGRILAQEVFNEGQAVALGRIAMAAHNNRP